MDDTEIEETLKVLQQMAPEEDQKQDLIKQAMEAEKAVNPDEPPPMVCPFHIELLVNVPNRKGYELLKCPEQPCLISVVGKDQAKNYMKGAYEKIHKDVENRWHELLCACGFPPALRQSCTEKNKDRMYLCCRNKDRCKFFCWADQPLTKLPVKLDLLQPPSETDYMICPCHQTRMEDCVSKQGWEYKKCPLIPCFLWCGKDKALDYMKAVHRDIHPDICDRWEKLNCYCGHCPVLKQSFTDKNPGRLYLSCGDNNRCKFFQWVDEPILQENWKDPLVVQDWLHTSIADLGESNNGKEIRPPIYGESVQDFQRRQQQMYAGRNSVTAEKSLQATCSKPEMVEIDPPVMFNAANFELDYVPLHKDVIERSKLGLF